METKRRGNQIDERGSGLQFNSWEIAIAGEIVLLEMPADAKPVACGLQWQMNGFAGF